VPCFPLSSQLRYVLANWIGAWSRLAATNDVAVDFGDGSYAGDSIGQKDLVAMAKSMAE